MKRERKGTVCYYGILVFVMLLCYFLQVLPGGLAILGTKPVLLAGFVVAVAMMQKEIPAAVFGISSGLLWDLSSPALFGFHGLIFLVGSVTISLFIQYVMRSKLISYLLFLGGLLLLDRFFYFLFYYLIWRYEDCICLWWYSFLPEIGYSTAVGILLYYLIGWLTQKFQVSCLEWRK